MTEELKALVVRLRNEHENCSFHPPIPTVFSEAADAIEALTARDAAVPDDLAGLGGLRSLIYRSLRDYRQNEVCDEYGCGYPLVDALTLPGHSIDMGEREIESISCMLAGELSAAVARAEAALAVAEKALRMIANPELPFLCESREISADALNQIAALKGGAQ